MNISRRVLAVIVLAGVGALYLLGGDSPSLLSQDGERYVASDCTPSSVDPSGNFEGIYFPARANLPGPGPRVNVRGHVLDATCRGVARVVIKFSAADANGVYTEDSYGSVVSAADGSFQFSTHHPGTYPNSEPHIHIMAEIEGVQVFGEVRPKQGDGVFVLDLVGGGVPPTTTAPPTTFAPGVEPFLP